MEQMSQKTTATNYAAEAVHSDVLYPLHPYKSPVLFNPSLELPSKYVLTKTHCSGYCDHCHYSEIVQDFGSFLDGCRAVDINRECRTERFLYSVHHVKKVRPQARLATTYIFAVTDSLMLLSFLF